MPPELFLYVSNFEILPFDPLLSDVHNGIAVEFISKPLGQISFFLINFQLGTPDFCL